MSDPLRHLSSFAEDAVGDIRLIVHEYVAARASATSTTTIGRFVGPKFTFGDRATQLAVANIVAVVELYAERVLLDAGCAASHVTSWGNKPSAWQSQFGVDIEDEKLCPSFAAMRGYYEVRNAVMHRRGELTHLQRRKAVYVRLIAAEIERVGFNIVVPESAVHACAEVCVRCVKELDETTRPQPANTVPPKPTSS